MALQFHLLTTSFILGGYRRRVTPVPIPNTVVKPSTADGTCFKRSWESMKLPRLIYNRMSCGEFGKKDLCLLN